MLYIRNIIDMLYMYVYTHMHIICAYIYIYAQIHVHVKYTLLGVQKAHKLKDPTFWL